MNQSQSLNRVSATSDWASAGNTEKAMEGKQRYALVWIGRLFSKTGYGAASRDYVNALRDFKPPEADFLVIDFQTGQTVFNSSQSFVVEMAGDHLRIQHKEEIPIHCVAHETPDKLARVVCEGRSRLVNQTVHETEALSEAQREPLFYADQVWVPSDWNKEMLLKEGFTDDFLHVVPHTISDAMVEALRSPSANLLASKFQSLKDRFVFMAIASNFERKNISVVVEAYLEAFDDTAKVALVIKLPKSVTEEEIALKVLPRLGLLHGPHGPVYLIAESLTDQDMLRLVANADCYINVESGKGWDIDSFRALAAGRPLICTLVGGATHYTSPDHCASVAHAPVRQYFDETNFSNMNLYANACSAEPSAASLAACLRGVFLEPEVHRQRARRFDHRPFNYRSIAGLIYGMVGRVTEPHEFRSLFAPKITLHLGSGKVAEKKSLPRALTEKEIDEANDQMRPPSAYATVDDWLAERRALYGRFAGYVPPRKHERDRLAALHNIHLGKRCFVIGNGPSLNKVDFLLLENEFTFAANRIYLKYPETRWRPNYFTALDWRVTPDNHEDITKVVGENPGTTYLFPNRFTHLLPRGENIYWYESRSPGPLLPEKFEPYAPNGVRGGGTVLTALIQLAFFLGFRDIYLIGVDASYSIQSTVRQSGKDRFNTGIKINLESTADDDPNHFAANYFGKGSRWHDPNVPEMLRGFRAAHRGVALHGGRLFNATQGGNLNCVPRVRFEDLFSANA